jgi:hypothetical protein
MFSTVRTKIAFIDLGFGESPVMTEGQHNERELLSFTEPGRTLLGLTHLGLLILSIRVDVGFFSVATVLGKGRAGVWRAIC